MEALINEYISRELVQDASLLPLGNTTPLLETGIVGSLGGHGKKQCQTGALEDFHVALPGGRAA